MEDNKPVRISLGRKGYIIHKEANYPDQLFEQISQDLTVSTKPNDYSRPKIFKIYGVDKQGNWVLPRYYGINKIGEPDVVQFKLGNPIPYTFLGKLRANQVSALRAVLKAFNDQGGGILSVPCGFGKTFMAIYLIYKVKRKAIIVVNRLELVKQWTTELERFLPKARVSVIDGGNVDSQNADVVIGMVNTIAMRDYPAQVFNPFDFLIVDECHTVATEIFSQCLPKIRPYYTLGLSASPERKDGLFKVVEYYLGDICYKEDAKLNSTKAIITNLIQYQKPSRKEIRNPMNGKPNISAMLNEMSDDPERNRFIAKIIHTIIQGQGKERQILLLADRKKMLATIKELLSTEFNFKEGQASLFTGDLKSEELDRAKKSQVLLGTYSICGTGFNLPRLNTLILATPRTQILQMVGRILRKEHNICPLIVDIADNYSIFHHQFNARKRYYLNNDILVEYPEDVEHLVLNVE